MVTLAGATCTGQDVAQRLASDGYVVVSGLMSEGDVAAARADLARILAATPTGRNAFEGFDTQRVYALFAKTRTFDRLAVHPLLLDVLDQVLGHYQLSAPVGIRIGPGEKAQILHRDVSHAIAASAEMQQVLRKVYEDDTDAAAVCELLVDLDEGMQEWRYHHIKMVQRTIGGRRGKGGSAGATYLQTTLGTPTFPDLWAMRSLG